MSNIDKALECLRRISIKCHPKSDGHTLIDDDLNTIKQALMSKSNAEIVLNNLKKKFKFEVNDYVKRIVIYSEEDQYAVQHTISDEEYDLFNKWLENKDLQPQKSNAERCWEIVKEKCDFIPLSKFKKNWTYELYVRWFDLNHYEVKYLLTEEEFEMIKRRCERK